MPPLTAAVDQMLRKLYGLYADYVLKNPVLLPGHVDQMRAIRPEAELYTVRGSSRLSQDRE